MVEMSQEEFSTRFRKSAIKRAKLAGLKRNALAVMSDRTGGETSGQGDKEKGRNGEGETGVPKFP
jgi:epoxyqueuosine reductase QueG